MAACEACTAILGYIAGYTEAGENAWLLCLDDAQSLLWLCLTQHVSSADEDFGSLAGLWPELLASVVERSGHTLYECFETPCTAGAGL